MTHCRGAGQNKTPGAEARRGSGLRRGTNYHVYPCTFWQTPGQGGSESGRFRGEFDHQRGECTRLAGVSSGARGNDRPAVYADMSAGQGIGDLSASLAKRCAELAASDQASRRSSVVIRSSCLWSVSMVATRLGSFVGIRSIESTILFSCT